MSRRFIQKREGRECGGRRWGGLPLCPGIKKQSLFNQGQLTLSQYPELIIPRLTAACLGSNEEGQGVAFGERP